MTDRHIMIQSVNDQCDVFTHITADIVWFCQEFRSLIDKVGSKKFIKNSVSCRIIKFLKAICEETEG